MAPISLDLKIISCKDLKAFNFFQKLSVYATVSISTPDSAKRFQPHKTPTDTHGDANPEWNHKAQFDLTKFQSPSHLHNLFLDFDFVNQGGLLLGEKPIGHVRVPIEDLLKDSNAATRFVSYQVATAEGSPNGVLEFSYKVVHDSVPSAPVIQYPEMYSVPAAISQVSYSQPTMTSTTQQISYPPAIQYPEMYSVSSSQPAMASQVSYSPPATTSTATTSQVSYHPQEVLYPPPVTMSSYHPVYPPVETSAGGGLYPPIEMSAEAWYPPQEVYYSPPSHFNVEDVHSFYPPPPSVYPAPPSSYGSTYSDCQLYPSVDPFRRYD